MSAYNSSFKKWLIPAVLVLASAGGAIWYLTGSDRPVRAGEPGPKAAVSVEVVAPRAGGIDRICSQPGTVEPLEAADLYAKVSGYLAEQTVDIGSHVTKGDPLCRIAVPEYEKQLAQDTAEAERADAKVEQMTAEVATAEAEGRAATALVSLAQDEQKSKASFREYREKQRERVRDLVSRRSVDAKLGDEQEDQYQAAVSAELAATEAVVAAKQKEAAAAARVRQARADLKFANAEVGVAKARLEKSQVLLKYTVITAPYTGVVTKRNFHPGEFVRSAEGGGERTPVLAVERTDIMRVVVQVPERDVPFVDVGDPAVVELDALHGRTFKTDGSDTVAVSRFAASEDPRTRLMRVEVDIKNPDEKVRRGMYGRVTLRLEPGAPTAFRVPSAALVGKAEAGKATVRVVRDDVVHVVPVVYGTDNGTDVEILSGLTAEDRVIVRASGPVDNGTAVTITPGKAGR